MITINESLELLDNIINGIEHMTASENDRPNICYNLEELRMCLKQLKNGLWFFGGENSDLAELHTAYLNPGESYDPKHSVFNSEEEWKNRKLAYDKHTRKCVDIVEVYNLKNYLKLMEECGDDNK